MSLPNVLSRMISCRQVSHETTGGGGSMATFEAEWEQIKHDVAAVAGMSLASADGKGGWNDDGSAGVKSNKRAWSTAGSDVGSLRGDIKKALTKLELEQKGLGAVATPVAPCRARLLSGSSTAPGSATGRTSARGAVPPRAGLRRPATTTTRTTRPSRAHSQGWPSGMRTRTPSVATAGTGEWTDALRNAQRRRRVPGCQPHGQSGQGRP